VSETLDNSDYMQRYQREKQHRKIQQIKKIEKQFVIPKPAPPGGRISQNHLKLCQIAALA
jgi:hypothetical protein